MACILRQPIESLVEPLLCKDGGGEGYLQVECRIATDHFYHSIIRLTTSIIPACPCPTPCTRWRWSDETEDEMEGEASEKDDVDSGDGVGCKRPIV
jgi:hypothetical protein